MSGPDCEIVCEECYQHYGNICKKDGRRKGFGTNPTHNAFWRFATEEEIRSNPGSSAPLVPFYPIELTYVPFNLDPLPVGYWPRRYITREEAKEMFPETPKE